jgi:dCMP deaminase
MKRLTRDEYFLAISNIVAARATCDRLWAGCVLVVDREIVATGYNGAPSGLPECDEVGHLMVLGEDGRPHCKRTVHAEQNALYQARKRHRNLKGAVAYINATSCENCLTELLKCGIRRVVCGSVYRNAERKEMTAQLAAAFGAIVEYHAMPDIALTFGTEISDVKRIQITRPSER